MDNIYIRFGNNLYRQIVGIPIDTNCVPLVAGLFLFCYKRDFMTSLSCETISIVLTILISNEITEPPELQLNKANTSDTQAPFLDLHLSSFNGFVSSKIYDKRDDFDFDVVNFPFLDDNVPRHPSYRVYISQLIR